ncbi:hypothetical protein [Achromobacter insuavis]|uniref:hypothetical protein n=1 Tax=Achromobacter insuavis TaxID=1287735 RepID=UPI001F12E1D7|nr:hypothetical protein [Achromobacter insuavis]
MAGGGIGQVGGGQLNGVAPVGVQQAPQNGNVQQAQGNSWASTLNTLVENVVGGTVHALSNVVRGIDLYVQSEAHAQGGPAPDLAEISRFTVLGSLPNAPGFQNAINDNGARSQLFNNALNNPNATQQETDVMTTLNGVALGNLTRGGQPLQMNQQEFHAALMCGGHFVVNDNGALANQLQQDGGGQMQARGSSHYKGASQQYGMDLPGVGHLLIGQTNNGDSFFQLESHGVGNPQQNLLQRAQEFGGHMLSWGMHVGSSSSYVQIGPHGAIEGSEKDNNHVVIH